jgi:aminoglycoside phosphotransferase (APT) family kinase protein
MKPRTELPDDPALPAIAAIRSAGLAATLPALDLGDGPIKLALCGYSPGERATVEVTADGRHIALKAYATDPESEAALYEALAAAGLAGDSGPRVPPLLAWDRDLRVVVIGWLEGPTAHLLVKNGQGARAGDLAARWLRQASSLPVKLGPPLGAAQMLQTAEPWVADLVASADPSLGTATTALVETLARNQPKEDTPHLVHGTLYDRHILDLGDGPGVIDWQRFGQGPLELDAGTFLATLSRIALRHPPLAAEAARAEEAFRAGIEGLVDERALAWHRAVALLRLAAKPVSPAGDERLRTKGKTDRPAVARARAHALLEEAALLVGAPA